MIIDNKLTLVVAILLATTTIGSTCKKKLICADNNTYGFINSLARAYPDDDSIDIGDTLWMKLAQIQISICTFFKTTDLDTSFRITNDNTCIVLK